MFCPNCGTRISDNAKFCGNCGYNVSMRQDPYVRPQTPCESVPQYGQPYMGVIMKSEVLSLILGILIPGSGHLYIGRLTRGLIILVTYFGISFIGIILMLSAFSYTYPSDMTYPALEVSLIFPLIILSMILLVIWIAQLIDVYNLTKQYNDTVRRTGQPPW
ncbi:MAG: zinc ribbon domain-containing protein [Euryarchaeota archaeon]|nr:zinc ribbon domain-containing protein [Euryarchaeota archaeon]